MKTKVANNNLVGRRVVIDWPVRWRGASPEFQEKLKAEAAQKEHYFGEEGEVTCYDAAERELVIILDKSKEIVRVYEGAITVKTVSPAEQDHKEVVSLLTQILEAIKQTNNHG